MYCVRCGSTGEQGLYRCVECYEDGEPDSDMCGSCIGEHIELEGNETARVKMIDEFGNDIFEGR